MQLGGQDGDDGVSVHEVAPAVHRQHPVGVAVVGEPDVGAQADDRLAELAGIGRATVDIDVHPVGCHVHLDHLRPRLGEGAGARSECCPVGAINDHLDAPQAPAFKAAQGVGDVAVLCVGQGQDLADVGPQHRARRPAGALHEGLDAVLFVVVELVAVRPEEFDPVVGGGVVRGGDDGAGVRSHVGGEERRGGGGQDAAGIDVGACREQPCRQGSLEQVAGAPGVADDEHGGAAVPGTEGGCRRATEPQSELRGQLEIGDAPDAVRAEQPAQWMLRTPCGAPPT